VWIGDGDSSFSLREKVGMRGLKSIGNDPHPSPLPEGEGISDATLYYFALSIIMVKPSLEEKL
jgi:hypothetical protein